MPIRPENRGRYPKTWKQMVAAARERSGNRCECDGKCGDEHEGGRCIARNGEPHPHTGSKVVLTLAHEHGVPLEETSIDRMFHACQRCHNKYDAPMRRRGIQERARETSGMKDLFSTIHHERAHALACCTLLPGSWDKRFAKSMSRVATKPDAKFTDMQMANIDRLAWKYRRQMPAALVPPSDPSTALGLAAQSLRIA